MSKKRVLLTNDDGISARGMEVLVNLFSADYEITVVAPKNEQSGKGHSFTYREGLTFEPSDIYSVPSYAVNGTPADCVKVALSHILDELPDFVVSGINDGENIGIAGFYSGTVAAAREAAFWHIPAVALSVSYNSSEFVNEYGEVALDMVNDLEKRGELDSPKRHFININFPGCAPADARGVRVVKQSLAYYNDSYTVKVDDDGSEKLFVNGKMVGVENSLEFDVFANKEGFITVTPHNIDTTSVEKMAGLTFFETREF